MQMSILCRDIENILNVIIFNYQNILRGYEKQRGYQNDKRSSAINWYI